MTQLEATVEAFRIIQEHAVLTGDFNNPPPIDAVAGGKPYDEMTFDEKQEYFAYSRLHGLDGSIEDYAYGGSDMASIHGISPYPNSSPLNLYHMKRGESKAVITPSQRDLFDAGHMAEDCLTAYFNRFNDEGYTAYPFAYQFRSKRWPHALANIDGIVVDRDGRIGVYENKTLGPYDFIRHKLYKESGVPPNYMMQLMHYLAVEGFDYAVINAQWALRRDVRAHVRVERPPDESLAYLMDAAEAFITNTYNGIAPSPFDSTVAEQIEADLAQKFTFLGKKETAPFSSDDAIRVTEAYIRYKEETDELLAPYRELEKERKLGLLQRQNDVLEIMAEEGGGSPLVAGESENFSYEISYDYTYRKGFDKELCQEKYPKVFDEVYYPKQSAKQAFSIKFKEKNQETLAASAA